MTSASQVIGRLDSWLAGHRPDYYARLRPGLTRRQVADLERFIGYRFPEPFRAFYRWRNGQENDFPGGGVLVGNLAFLGAGQVRKYWRLWTEMQEGGEWEEPQWWCRGWVPFLDGQGSRQICVDCHGSFTGKRGQVAFFDGKYEGRSIEAPTFLAWLSRLVETLEAGEWTWSEERGQLEWPDGLPRPAGYPIWHDARAAPRRRPRRAKRAEPRAAPDPARRTALRTS